MAEGPQGLPPVGRNRRGCRPRGSHGHLASGIPSWQGQIQGTGVLGIWARALLVLGSQWVHFIDKVTPLGTGLVGRKPLPGQPHPEGSPSAPGPEGLGLQPTSDLHLLAQTETPEAWLPQSASWGFSGPACRVSLGVEKAHLNCCGPWGGCVLAPCPAVLAGEGSGAQPQAPGRAVWAGAVLGLASTQGLRGPRHTLRAGSRTRPRSPTHGGTTESTPS